MSTDISSAGIMNYSSADHTFAICAYKESAFLEECILSLMAQSVKTNVLIATSTPNDFIKGLADKYGITLHINEKAVGKSDIASDWNYAVSCCGTKLVTIAHQDDIYYPEYAAEVLKYAGRAEHPLIIHTDYEELRDGERVRDNRLLRIKRLMLLPMKPKAFWPSVFIRRRILSFGSPICCPSVTFEVDNVGKPVFEKGFKCNPDWQAWERISKKKGDFVYCPEYLMAHRIHEDSATTALIADRNRHEEDMQMFRKFWPAPIAAFIERFYQKSEDQNAV